MRNDRLGVYKEMKKQLVSIAAATTLFAATYAEVGAAQTHTVQSGDTLWKLSNTYNLSINQLMEWNQLKSSTIVVGQKLKVNGAEQTSTYTVKSGDSLWKIAHQHGISVIDLKNINGLSSDRIYPGQKLKLKVSSGGAPSTPNTNQSTYIVQSGDSLWLIASKHQLSVAQLKNMNNLTTDVIRPGQVLKVSSSNSSAGGNQTSNNQKSQVNKLIKEAKKHIGVPYTWGGNSPSSGFDCSGFLKYVFNQIGVSIPRTVETIWQATTSVSSPQPGDIVFFETYKKGPSHAGIYLGNNQFIHAGTSTGVTIADMSSSYWKPKYLGAKTAL